MFNVLAWRRKAVPPAVPPGLIVYAIGDVHGCQDLLDRLIDAITVDADARGETEPTFIFTGDLIDRGPNSSGVIDRLMRLRSEQPSSRFLLGNHEELFLAALRGEERALKAFSRIGGRDTAISYGLTPSAYDRMDYDELHQALLSIVPDDHQQFLSGFEDMVVLGDYAFVHAGVDPRRPLDDQRASDLRWIRSPFLEHQGTLDKVVVHGHTMSDNVEWRPHRIGVDTGAYRTGRLSALALQGESRWVVQVSSRAEEGSGLSRERAVEAVVTVSDPRL